MTCIPPYVYCIGTYRFWISILCFFVWASGYAQTVYSIEDFQNYSVYHGLSDNSVNALTFDSLGYLWVGTKYGLNRFDGNSFDVFTIPSHPDVLPGNYISSMERYAPNKMYLCTRNGLGILDMHRLKLQRYKLADTTIIGEYMQKAYSMRWLTSDKLAVSSTTGFYVFNADGSIYFDYTIFQASDFGQKRISFGQEIFQIGPTDFLVYANKSRLYLYNVTSNTLDELNSDDSNQWNEFMPDKNNWTIKKQWGDRQYLLLGLTDGQLKYIDLDKGLSTTISIPNEILNELYWASYIFPLDSTHFAINYTNHGFILFSLDPKNGLIKRNPTIQLPEYRCNTILPDDLGHLWIGTDQGILHETTKPFIKSNKITIPDSENENQFISDVLPLDHKIVVATYNQKHALLLLNENFQLEKTIDFNSSQKMWNEVWRIHAIDSIVIWCETTAGPVSYELNTGKIQPLKEEIDIPDGTIILHPIINSSRVLIYSVLHNYIKIFDLNTKSLSNVEGPIRHSTQLKAQTYQDNWQNIWIYGDGLIKWHLPDNTIETDFGTPLLNQSSNILSITADKAQTVYITTESNGMFQYDQVSQHASALNMEGNNLAGTITALSPVINHNLWMWQSGRLVNYNTLNKTFWAFGNESGLPVENTSASFIKYSEPDNQFYFSTTKHILTFGFPKENSDKSHRIIIKEIAINNGRKIIHPGDQVTLRPKENSFTISVTNLDFEHEFEEIHYRLDESAWVPMNNGNATFINLDQGSHQLVFKAYGKQQRTQTEIMWLEVLPPYYRTGWFFTLALLALITIGGFLYHRQIKNLEEKSNLALELSEAEMKALHAQMNPHFLFNCLNTIKSLILQSKITEASRYLSIFSGLIRSNLDHSRQVFISLQEQMDYIEKYLQMEKLRFSNFTFELQVDPVVPLYDQEIPAMIIQPLVENAIWHGLQHSHEDKSIKISIYENNDRIFCQIDDNGIGLENAKKLPRKPHASISLGNIQNRIILLNRKYPHAYDLKLQDKTSMGQKGTMVIFSFNKQ